MYLHQTLTGKVIGACYTVHNELGCGFYEKVYQEALAIVLREEGIPFEREKHLPIEFHGQILDCDYIADFVIDNAIILELKAVSDISSTYESQVINYLKATGLHYWIQWLSCEGVQAGFRLSSVCTVCEAHPWEK